MKNVLSLKKNGAKMTGVAFWGVSDAVTWIKGEKPLLFSTLGNPKQAYYAVLQAYADAGISTGSSSQTSVTAASLSDGWYYIKNTNFAL